jgi:hypothetical protein
LIFFPRSIAMRCATAGSRSLHSTYSKEFASSIRPNSSCIVDSIELQSSGLPPCVIHSKRKIYQKGKKIEKKKIETRPKIDSIVFTFIFFSSRRKKKTISPIFGTECSEFAAIFSIRCVPHFR